MLILFFFFQAEDGIRDRNVTGVQTCALPISQTSLLISAIIQVWCSLPRTGLSFRTRSTQAAAWSRQNSQPLRDARRNRAAVSLRSEERRVGKECGARRWTCDKKRKGRECGGV